MMQFSLCMWGGEKIENEIKRLVKILTKCKMKLKSRRRRDKMKLWDQAGRGQVLLCSALSILAPYLSLHRVQSSLDYLTRAFLRHGSEEPALQLSLLQLFCSSLLLHKLPKQQSGSEGQLLLFWLAGPASLPSYSGRPAHRTLAPSPNRVACCFSPVLVASSLWRLEPQKNKD